MGHDTSRANRNSGILVLAGSWFMSTAAARAQSSPDIETETFVSSAQRRLLLVSLGTITLVRRGPQVPGTAIEDSVVKESQPCFHVPNAEFLRSLPDF
jgi:hypothetical protein